MRSNGSVRRTTNQVTLAMRDLARVMLLGSLERNGWNMSAVAREFDYAGPSSVIKALLDYAPEEYAAAKLDGRIAHGRPSLRVPELA